MKIKYLTLLPLVACAAFPMGVVSCREKDPTIDEIYNLLKTPFKYKEGAVLKDDEYWTDSPSVFYHNGKYYMTYIQFKAGQTDESGYETFIAQSTDMINWTDRTKIFARNPSSGAWDCQQVAGYMGFIKNDLFGDYALQGVGGNYYIPYLGGASAGYEHDPLSMGLASFTDPMDPSTYTKFPKPILSPNDPGARQGEDKTIYKSNMFVDDAKTLGHRYVNFYNGKGQDNTEGIFIAVSDDAQTWTRYGDSYVFKDEGAHNTGDPIIIKYKNIYIMLYYVLTFDGQTYDNFAISKDLVHWTPWRKEPLIKPEYEWENKYAHKPSIIYKDGVLYHFYCAVNKIGDNPEERFIAVAASKPFEEINND